ncbi:MAG: maleylacetoacetate isomerase [Alphaproteobacteria bacterium]|nr:maleylacetoacetate isomerase [Alphaproteobacteria bacterium]
MLKLYSMDFNSAGQRVRTALHLKRVPFEYVSVKDIGWDAYRKINPQGLMPTLDIGGGRLFAQSTAILEYLEESYPEPALLPMNPVERAECRAFAQHIACDMHPLHVTRVRKHLMSFGLTEAQTHEWYRHWMTVGLTALEENLRRRPRRGDFCFGDRPTLADLYLVPQVMNGRRYKTDLSPFPLIGAIDAACRALPAFQSGMPERQSDFSPPTQPSPARGEG